ncbi:NAD(+)/NADH kinase [Alkalibacter mobilis]|uniref:NAD(+)/NADH kinase n=1 Tax=Alkalibacter mobilis TaxID=2787712 RepID=UPI00189F83A6|nr:NAD(+)/NADH kinase [Alkalibacter mobilis]MBF7096547.1 NAD(+)/NADH kinase [Alkalibacter mobilis]
MKKIGIIANPNSGKDIRRIFSYAMTIGNNEKANMVERMILGAQDLGVEKFYIMPDAYNMGASVKNTLENNGDLKSEISVLNMNLKNTWEDTIEAAEKMESENVDCIIVMGGDGTSRLIAKARVKTPIISVSTGTNNVYPEFLEGTVAGMAAAALAQFGNSPDYVDEDKVIDIYLNGTHVDVALVDAVVTKNMYVGSRAVWDINEISEIIVSRAHPASIGFSSVIGINTVCLPQDNFGYRIKINEGTKRFLAPFSPGKMSDIKVDESVKMDLDQMYIAKTSHKGTIALDGERAVMFNEEDVLGFVIRRNGPLRVDVNKILEHAVKNNFFERINQ